MNRESAAVKRGGAWCGARDLQLMGSYRNRRCIRDHSRAHGRTTPHAIYEHTVSLNEQLADKSRHRLNIIN